MSDSQPTPEAPSPKPHDTQALAKLIRAAGRRPPVPSGAEARVRQTVQAKWRGAVQRRRQRVYLFTGAGAAAALIALALLVSWYRDWSAGTPVATVECVKSSGNTTCSAEGQPARALASGQALSSGSIVQLAEQGGLACRLVGGQELRLLGGSRARLESAQKIVLESGAVYVDSQGAQNKPVEIQTAFGTARDVGTQFEVRLLNQSLTVRVRQGKVALQRQSQTHVAEAGTELAVTASGSLTQRAIATTGSEWDWVAACAPAFVVEGATLQQFLEWSCREKGWKLQIASEGLRQKAPTLKLHGSVENLSVAQALDTVLPTCGVDHREENDTLIVTERETPGGGVGVVSFVKVLSDKVEDVSSMDAWKASFIKPGMTDEQKALAVWTSTVKFRYQDSPPREYIQEGADVHDALKTFNVYGYGMCCCAASNIEQLARYAGLKARGWGVIGHSLSEVYYDGAWRLLDGSLITYYPKADGKNAGVEELCEEVTAWYEKNPEFKGNGEKLAQFMRGRGWKKGPPIIANCPFLDDNGWFPAATHGWYSPMSEFSEKSKTFIYEYGYSQGYQVNIQLRAGERLTRNWSNKGLHVNVQEGRNPGCLTGKVGEDSMRYTPKYGDIAPGRVGNGTHVYEVPLANGVFRQSALSAVNLASKSEDNLDPAVHVKDAAQPGTLILRMPSSYVYLGGELNFKAAVGEGGEIGVSFSDTHGLAWREVCKLSVSGDQKIDLTPLVLRRYDYRLRFELKGKGTGLESLRIAHDIQCSQRALPALGKGPNTITFSAGPAESTITLEGSFNPEWKGKNALYTDFQPEVQNMSGDPLCVLYNQGRPGSITFTVNTPAEMARLRFGAHYRARDERDFFDLLVSFDNGLSFKAVDRLAGPTPGDCKYVTFSDIPAGATKALVRFKGQVRNTTCLMGYRIDADYREPNGGFRPVKITYIWDENGQEKRDVKIADKPEVNYTINCATRPTMKSIVLELAE